MGQLLILLAVALVAAALAWGVAVLLLGRDPGLEPAEPDGRAVPLPTVRPLTESDINLLRFDTGARGYRMVQVDQALRRAAYDIGYKEELINVLEAEVAALREGRSEDAETLRRAREAAQRPRGREPVDAVDMGEPDDALDDDSGGDDTGDDGAPADKPGPVAISEEEAAAAAEAAPDALAGPDGTAADDGTADDDGTAADDRVASGARSKGGPGAEPADAEK